MGIRRKIHCRTRASDDLINLICTSSAGFVAGGTNCSIIFGEFDFQIDHRKPDIEHHSLVMW